MRLLNVHTRKLKEVVDSSIPPYAILSHTWGDAEVTYQDLNNPNHVLMKGYAKIKGTCDQAAKQGIAYVWIDTCCIDKTSSAELSEAINSMYNWYKRSTICYTYLSDVTTTDDLHEPGSAFRRSRWFTRGWTLQELIAPSLLCFYDQKWNYLGTKNDLASLVQDITTIPRDFLLADHDPFIKRPMPCHAIVMSWAASRRTSRAEDLAYCLLGLFDVQMPLLYGEETRAFRRLQLEILKQSSDESLLAWGLDLSVRLTVEGVLKDPFVEYSGILAPAPSSFHSWQGLYSSSTQLSMWHPRSQMKVTSDGLELAAPLIKTDDDVQFMVLNCSYPSGLENLLIVPLLAPENPARIYQRNGPTSRTSWSELQRARMSTITIAIADVDGMIGSLQHNVDPVLGVELLIIRPHAACAIAGFASTESGFASNSDTNGSAASNSATNGSAASDGAVSDGAVSDGSVSSLVEKTCVIISMDPIDPKNQAIPLERGFWRTDCVVASFIMPEKTGDDFVVVVGVKHSQPKSLSCVVVPNPERSAPESFLDYEKPTDRASESEINGTIYAAWVREDSFLGFDVHYLETGPPEEAPSLPNSSLGISKRSMTG